jgi:hypothetical protein
MRLWDLYISLGFWSELSVNYYRRYRERGATDNTNGVEQDDEIDGGSRNEDDETDLEEDDQNFKSDAEEILEEVGVGTTAKLTRPHMNPPVHCSPTHLR